MPGTGYRLRATDIEGKSVENTGGLSVGVLQSGSMSLGGTLILAGLFSIFGGSSQKAYLTELAVGLDEGRLEVSFRLRDAIDEELIERIEAGLPGGFRYQFKLVRPSKVWFDNTVVSGDLEVVARYDAVTREYQVNYKQNGKLTVSRMLKERAELESALTHFEQLIPFSLEDVNARRPLHLRMRAELGSRNILLLIPTTVHTEWIESGRFQIPESVPDTE